MIRVIIIVLFVICWNICAHAQTQNSNDGPYVSYKDKMVYLRTIKSDSVAHIDSFDISRKSKTKLRIEFSNHTGWDFTVPLRKKIANEKNVWPQPDKIFAVSDIEGEFDNFRTLLIAANVIDSNYKWIFGKGHLVICGDFFDRGNNVVPELWLLYKLEDEARAAGGYVHTILGNHDIMNMSGDLRYLQPKYFQHAKSMGLDYMDLYDKDTELGRWLRSKNIIEKIGDNLCLDGGVSPSILAHEMDIEPSTTPAAPFMIRQKIKTH